MNKKLYQHKAKGMLCRVEKVRFVLRVLYIHFVPFREKSGVKSSPTGVKEAHVPTAARYDDKLEPTEN